MSGRGCSAGSQTGAIGLTTALVAVLLLTAAAAALTAVADLAVTSARARAAADAAALAAAAMSPLVTGDADDGRVAAADAARRAARANGARLLATDLTGWPLRVGVEVALQPTTPWVRRLGTPLRAGATAGVRPRDG